jgi:hypothetical protein
VVYGIRIVGVALQNLREFLNRPLIVHVIEMLKGGRIERIGRPEREFGLSQAERKRESGQGRHEDREFPEQEESLEAVYPSHAARVLRQLRESGIFALCK